MGHNIVGNHTKFPSMEKRGELNDTPVDTKILGSDNPRDNDDDRTMAINDRQRFCIDKNLADSKESDG
jgi:hypothetical protein